MRAPIFGSEEDRRISPSNRDDVGQGAESREENTAG